jgi:nucleoside-diphosphate-sugar epimerase
MHIAILGATSQIAKDLIRSFDQNTGYKLTLFGRNVSDIKVWQQKQNFFRKQEVFSYDEFSQNLGFDAIINFVGIGDPARAQSIGRGILDLTAKYDVLATEYVNRHPYCRYLFLSSGAVFGPNYDVPVNEHSYAKFPINHPQPHDWYGIAKLQAEYLHRSFNNLNIVDLRVFNYFSHTQDMGARFLITDAVRAIRDKIVLKTNGDNLTRDFLHPEDFYQLVFKVLTSEFMNTALDCYTQNPIDKFSLLNSLNEQFNLCFEITNIEAGIQATGSKINYYSLNHAAEKLGYKPRYSSLAGISVEVQKYLNTLSSK